MTLFFFLIDFCTVHNCFDIFRANNNVMNTCFTLLSCVWSYDGMTKRFWPEDSMGAGVSTNEYPNLDVQNYPGVIIK